MRRYGAVLVSTALAAGLLAGGTAGAAPGPTGDVAPPDTRIDGSKTIEYVIPTRHGHIYAEAVHPTSRGRIVRSPAILTLSPYSVLGRNGDAQRWVPRGYTRIWADVLGTGNSGGCWDYGGRKERQSGYDVVEWIADQRWSTGRIAMMGGSYNGTTATATAVERPPHLTTIIPEAAISRWYGYAYSGGIRYSYTNEPVGPSGPGTAADEGFDTPLLFDFGFAVPPPTDPHNEHWADRVASSIRPCEEVEHTTHGYDFDTPNYGRFWKERDYVRRAGRVRIPVLIAHNWGDWNVKQAEAWNLFHALDNSEKRVLYMGTRWDGHGRPGGRYDKVVEAWLDHYLKGENNGIQRLPSVISQTSTSQGPGRFTRGRPRTHNITLYAQNVPPQNPGDYPWKLLPMKPVAIGFGDTVADFPSLGINTESHAAHHARNNHDWFWFETPPLRRDVRVFGEIKLQIYSTVHRRWVTVAPSIIDFDPADHVMAAGQHVNTDPRALVAVTRGFLDSRYRHGLARPKPIKPGVPFGMTVEAKPTDYTFKKGHYIGLNVQTEINEWMIPKPYPGCESFDQTCAFFRVNWEEGRTRLVIPVVRPPRNPMKLFDMGGHHHHG